MSTATVFRRLVREFLETPGVLAGAVASLLVLSLSQLYLTWLAKRWLEEGLAARDVGMVVHVMSLAAAVSVVLVLAIFASSYLLASLNQSLVARLRDRAQARLLRARLDMLRGFPSGDLVSRLFNDAAAVSGFAESLLKRLIGEGFLVVGAVSLMIYLEWRLALAAFVAAPPIVWLVARLGRTIRSRGTHAQQELGALGALFGEQLAGFTTIKGFQSEAFEADRFGAQNEAYRQGVMRSEWWASALLGAVWLLTALGLLFVAGYGTELVIRERLTQGVVFSFCLYAIQTIEPVRRISEVYGRLQRTLAAAERVYEIIDLPWVEEGGDRELARPVRGELRLEQLSFRYRTGRSVLDSLTIEIRSRETVAVVAASGGGKTTLAALVCRFYDPTGGRVLVDGVDLRELELASLRGAVCVVEQEAFVFGGSLFENVRYGDASASREVVAAALGRAGLGAWVAELPGGLDARLAEGGRNLSGGQKQRIALARAIVRDPAILILDEATSALDGEIEAQIFADIRPWLAERTVLVMAHRFATVGMCPRVLVLADGRLVADGSVAELRAGSPAFVQLFAEQLLPVESENRELGTSTGAS